MFIFFEETGLLTSRFSKRTTFSKIKNDFKGKKQGMKKILSICLFLMLLATTTTAQVKIGYYSNKKVLEAMPEYTLAQNDFAQLKEQYAQEADRAEKEFNAKYEEFLNDLKSLTPTIRRKRQEELKQFMESNIRFREEVARLLAQAEQDAITPLQNKINTTLRLIAAEYSLDIILNTDSNACPYLSPSIGEDINDIVRTTLSSSK